MLSKEKFCRFDGHCVREDEKTCHICRGHAFVTELELYEIIFRRIAAMETAISVLIHDVARRDNVKDMP